MHAWPTAATRPPHRNGGNGGRRNGGSSISSGGSPRDHDALSDTVSHHSVSSTGMISKLSNSNYLALQSFYHIIVLFPGVTWAGQRQPSQTGSSSLRSGSAASVEGNGIHGPSILSKEPSESTLTTTESGGGNASQTPSCRALAGSLASFDTSSIVNTEGMEGLKMILYYILLSKVFP